MTRYTHRWVFVNGLTPEVEYAVRHWLTVRLNGFYCDLQAMYTPHLSVCGWPFCAHELGDAHTGGGAV